MLRKLFILAVILNCCLEAMTSDKKISEDSKKRQEAKYAILLHDQARTSSSSKIDVSGIIVDDKGAPLNDVELEFNFSRAKGWESESLNKKVVSKSRFSFTQSGYTGVTVYFRKKGYFTETRFYGTYQASKYLKNKIYTQTDEKIVLREKGKFAKIKIFEKLLEYDWTKKQKSFCDLADLSYKTLSADSPIKAKRYIYLDFERDQNGNVVMIKHPHYERMIPKAFIIKYVSRYGDGGFIIKGNQINMTYLTTAPTSGYNDKSIKISIGSKDIYFYYKNGDTFGKGALLSPSHTYGVSSVWLKLMQNVEKDPNEKYNLRSDER